MYIATSHKNVNLTRLLGMNFPIMSLTVKPHVFLVKGATWSVCTDYSTSDLPFQRNCFKTLITNPQKLDSHTDIEIPYRVIPDYFCWKWPVGGGGLVAIEKHPNLSRQLQSSLPQHWTDRGDPNKQKSIHSFCATSTATNKASIWPTVLLPTWKPTPERWRRQPCLIKHPLKLWRSNTL